MAGVTARTTLADVLRRSVRAHALGGGAKDVVEAVRRAGFVYGSAPTCHLAVLARTRGHAPSDLDRAVVETRSLVRVRAMRGSVYLVPRDAVPHALALTPLRSVEHYAKVAGIAVSEFAPLTDRIARVLGAGPRTAAEIREALGGKAPAGPGLSAVLGRMGREARIVRAAVRGGARSQEYEYALMRDWIDLPDERPSVAEALRALAPAWMAANGPATAADLAWWAGVAKRDAKAALASLGARPVVIAGLDGEQVATQDVLDDLAHPPPDDEVHLVSCWDSYVMAHTDRSRYLAEAHRPLVIDRMGNVTNVVLVGGRVAGIWDVDGPTLLHATFGDAKVPKRALAAAAKRLAPLHEVERIDEVGVPPPLASRPKNAFLAPLRGSKRSDALPG